MTADDAAHVQRYTFATLSLENGETHKTGQVELMSDEMMRRFLNTWITNNVLPVMMLLSIRKTIFYGVQHGDLFFD